MRMDKHSNWNHRDIRPSTVHPHNYLLDYTAHLPFTDSVLVSLLVLFADVLQKHRMNRNLSSEQQLRPSLLEEVILFWSSWLEKQLL